MRKNPVIGYAYVVGDILHFGHIQHLRNCKVFCDKLVVGVLTDRATMEKKPRPIISFNERFLMVGELKSVDVVVAQDTYTPKYNCRIIKPDVLFESESHPAPCKNPYGRVLVMPYFPNQSSTKIKDKIRGQS